MAVKNSAGHDDLRQIIVPFIFSFAFALGAQGQTPAQITTPLGKAVYEQNCLACHQIDGSGVPHLTPSLINSTFVQGDNTRLITILLNGMKDVKVDGQFYDNPMPSFSALTDDEIANVLTYIRSSFGNNAAAVKKDEVATARKPR